ncbi:MAG: hypothetical protein AB7F65_06180 [Dehalococcoidia bacterium]
MAFSGHHWHGDHGQPRCCQCGDLRRDGDFTQPATCRGTNARPRETRELTFSWQQRRAS